MLCEARCAHENQGRTGGSSLHKFTQSLPSSPGDPAYYDTEWLFCELRFVGKSGKSIMPRQGEAELSTQIRNGRTMAAPEPDKSPRSEIGNPLSCCKALWLRYLGRDQSNHSAQASC